MVIGMMIFKNSEGWNLMKPRSSQRCAPLPMWPNTMTHSSSTMQTAKAGGAQRA